MPSINIIGPTSTVVGVLDLDERFRMTMERGNPQGAWGQVSTGRSVEFSVPATANNRELLSFSEDPAEWGDAMRIQHRCQVQYSAGAFMARLSVTEFSGNRFSCVIYFPLSDTLEKLNGKKLSDCLCTIKAVRWHEDSAVDANSPTLPVPVGVIKYTGPYTDFVGTTKWCWLPSINIKHYIEDVLGHLQVRNLLNIPTNYYLITPTLHGSTAVTGTIAKTGLTAGTISAALQDYFDFKTDARLTLFNRFGALTMVSCWAIRPKIDVKVTFPNDFPSNYELVKCYGNSVTHVTDRYKDDDGWHGEELANRTVSIGAGQWFFIVEEQPLTGVNNYKRGWIADASPFSFTFEVERDGDIDYGDTWSIANNAPDMTVMEFLQSVALMLGKELYYDEANDQIVIDEAMTVGLPILPEVTGVESVKRCVEDWGSDTASVVVRYDSEDYVTVPIVMRYDVHNLNNTSEDTKTIKWSEGNPNDDGSGCVYVKDVKFDGVTPQLAASKWTVGYAGSEPYLMRASIGRNVYCGALADESTCVVIDILQDIDDFIRLGIGTLIYYGGMWYVWTSAVWEAGITKLTMQQYL